MDANSSSGEGDDIDWNTNDELEISAMEYKGSFLDDFSDIDGLSESEETTNCASDKENKLLSLSSMGYTVYEASIAMERCGSNSTIVVLIDFICAAQMAKVNDALLEEIEEKVRPMKLCNDHQTQEEENVGLED
ncbi:hypothetical protein QYF36_014965 [Acer negundo]|nr:hypothetical protein QYF36_014965 [Acer negundo]